MGGILKVILLCTFIFSACSSVENKEDEFYTTFQYAHWEVVPLIKPYVLYGNSPVFENGMWLFFKDIDSPKYFLETISDVKYVSVADSVICLWAGVIGPVDSSTPKVVSIGNYMYYTAWFVLDVRKKIEKGFPTEEQFKQYLEVNCYPPPHWLEIDSLSKQLDKEGTHFPWWPNK